MKCFAFVLLSALIAAAAAGTVTINGSCRNCSPPDAETVIVGGQVHKGTPGHGTVIIGSPSAYPNAVPHNRGGGGGGNHGHQGGNYGPQGGNYGPQAGHSGAHSGVQGGNYDGYSGRLPGGTYLHNKDCVGCSISGGRD